MQPTFYALKYDYQRSLFAVGARPERRASAAAAAPHSTAFDSLDPDTHSSDSASLSAGSSGGGGGGGESGGGEASEPPIELRVRSLSLLTDLTAHHSAPLLPANSPNSSSHSSFAAAVGAGPTSPSMSALPYEPPTLSVVLPTTEHSSQTSPSAGASSVQTAPTTVLLTHSISDAPLDSLSVSPVSAASNSASASAARVSVVTVSPTPSPTAPTTSAPAPRADAAAAIAQSTPPAAPTSPSAASLTTASHATRASLSASALSAAVIHIRFLPLLDVPWLSRFARSALFQVMVLFSGLLSVVLNIFLPSATAWMVLPLALTILGLFAAAFCTQLDRRLWLQLCTTFEYWYLIGSLLVMVTASGSGLANNAAAVGWQLQWYHPIAVFTPFILGNVAAMSFDAFPTVSATYKMILLSTLLINAVVQFYDAWTNQNIKKGECK
jgi:hypothetical protein